MNTMNERRVLVLGGSQGLGLGVVHALVAEGAQVTLLACDGGRLAEVAAALPVATLQGDVVDAQVIHQALASAQPNLPMLNGGVAPHTAPLPQQSCGTFTRDWDVDVKATFDLAPYEGTVRLYDPAPCSVGAAGPAVGQDRWRGLFGKHRGPATSRMRRIATRSESKEGRLHGRTIALALGLRSAHE